MTELLIDFFMFDSNLAEIAQSVEHQFPKLKAAGSNPVFRSFYNQPYITESTYNHLSIALKNGRFREQNSALYYVGPIRSTGKV